VSETGRAGSNSVTGRGCLDRCWMWDGNVSTEHLMMGIN
jgi:hypothetical protein